MNPFLVKIIFRPFVKRATYAALIGRNRDPQKLEEGRFTRADIDKILEGIWSKYDRLAPLVPQEPKLGNRMNMLLACTTLACLQVMTSSGIERTYALQMIGDLAWKIYKGWGGIPRFITRLITQDPVRRMRMCVDMFLRFPFTPPGYLFERKPIDNGISLDVLRCPVAEYFNAQNASDLCLATWCNLDFPLTEMWGGKLERAQTLASGDRRCDFRFKVTV